jgi:hypothetical protein
MTRRIYVPALSLSLCSLPLLAALGCSDEVKATCTADNEGQSEPDGPRCCSKGCGNSGEGWLPRVCHDGEWVCEGSAAVLEDACASDRDACNPMDGCHTVGIDKEEQDPAPELCCFPSCAAEGTCVQHRVCKDGTLWECPGGSIPISRCTKPDYKTACGGVLQRYRDNNYKVPDDLLCK